MLRQLIILGLIVASGFIYYRLSSTANQFAPYPYSISARKQFIKHEAPIVLLGDRMGARLALFKDELSRIMSKGLSRPIQIQDLTQDNAGLHRSLDQLNALSQFPKVIIYHGASQEQVEYRFVTNEIPHILKNFEFFNDPKLKTYLTLFPWFSKFLYLDITKINLAYDQIILDKNQYTATQQQARNEIHFLMYKAELEDLVKLARDNNAILILITTPTNPNVEPKLTCENALQPNIEESYVRLKQLIESNELKSAYREANILRHIAQGHAAVYFDLYKLAMHFGNRELAIEAHDLLTAFDCVSWRSNSVYNSIIRKIGKDEDVIVYDFDQYLKSKWGENVLFFDEIYPQDLYYQNMVNALARMLRRALNL
jgi:hypothetical protein